MRNAHPQAVTGAGWNPNHLVPEPTCFASAPGRLSELSRGTATSPAPLTAPTTPRYKVTTTSTLGDLPKCICVPSLLPINTPFSHFTKPS